MALDNASFKDNAEITHLLKRNELDDESQRMESSWWVTHSRKKYRVRCQSWIPPVFLPRGKNTCDQAAEFEDKKIKKKKLCDVIHKKEESEYASCLFLSYVIDE